MNQSLIDNNYLILPNFLDPDRAKELHSIFKKSIESNPAEFARDEQCPKSLSVYDYRWFLELLVESAPVLSDIMQEPILPTYCYARMYQHGEELVKHKDRPSCEISVSLNLDSDGTSWPLYFTKPNGEVASVELNSGQAVLYLGCVSTHWRDRYEGHELSQVFLHYVRSRGPYWDFYFDKQKKC
jgi:hypothetical protein